MGRKPTYNNPVASAVIQGQKRLELLAVHQQKNPEQVREYNKQDIFLFIDYWESGSYYIKNEKGEFIWDEEKKEYKQGKYKVLSAHKLFMNTILKRAAKDGTNCFLTDATIARFCGWTEKTARKIRHELMEWRVYLSDDQKISYHQTYKIQMAGVTPAYDIPPQVQVGRHDHNSDVDQVDSEFERMLAEALASEEEIEEENVAIAASQQPNITTDVSQQLPQVYDVNGEKCNSIIEEIDGPTEDELLAWACEIKEQQLLHNDQYAIRYAETHFDFSEQTILQILEADPAMFGLNQEFFRAMRIKHNQEAGWRAQLLYNLGHKLSLTETQIFEIIARPIEEWSIKKYLQAETETETETETEILEAVKA